VYRDAAIKALSEELDHARERRNRLREAKLATSALDQEIVHLRRQLHEGGQLLAGDALGDGRYLLVKPVGRGGFSNLAWRSSALDLERCSSQLKAVLAQAVAWEPGERFADAGVMQRALRDALGGQLAPILTVEAPPSVITEASPEQLPPMPMRDEQLRDALGGQLAPLVAVGAPPSVITEASPEQLPPMPMRDEHHGVKLSPAPAATLRRFRGLWLVGALIAVAIAVVVLIADRSMVRAGDRQIASALVKAVDQIAVILDGAARSGGVRADGLATTGMLRAAIGTDAATLNDMSNTEMVFTADHGEVLEVFQFRGERATSLLRIPKAALSVQPLRGRTTRFHSDGKAVTVVASAPISGFDSESVGGLVIASPIDLTPIQRTLNEHTTSATLTGLGDELVLVGSGHGASAGTPVKLDAPASGDWNAVGVKLIATPKPAVGLAWVGLVCVMSGGVAVLLLAVFLCSLRTRPRS
jgi:hypothetical protein